jgi:hypothetical protein
MRSIKIIPVFLFSFLLNKANAQELNARVTVNSSQVSTNVNKKAFQTLQNVLTIFLNSRKWTGDNFLPNEKIDCNFLLNLQQTEEANVYSASLTVQAARPVFNTSYLSPLINYHDEDISFKYIEFQQFVFNENRISGSDAQMSNLPAVFAYYAYLILGFDYDSYSLKGGNPYFLKAQNIVNNAPEARGITGWKAFDGVRNRYWLVENMLNSRYAIMHDIIYNYYRLSLDKLYEDENAGRAQMMNVINLLNNFNNDNPNTMINQFFFQGKTNELIKIFSKAPQQDKMRASELLQKLDLTNSARYKNELR